MATSTLTDTVKDPGGNVVATSPGTVVNFRLMANGSPTPGFRISDGVNVASLIVTSASTAGAISQALENNSNIVPIGTYYVAEILCPSSQGGTQEWAILSSSSSSPQKFHDALISAIPSYSPPTTVPPTILGGNNTFTGVNQFNGNVYFRGVPFVDPMAFGCAGDGTTDDTTAFQTAATNASGSVLYISKNFKVGTITLPAGLVGITGPGTITQLAANSNLLDASSTTGLTIDGVRFVGVGGTTLVSSNEAIIATSASKLRILNNVFSGFLEDAVHLIACTDTVVMGNVVSGVSHGMFFQGCIRLHVANNIIRDPQTPSSTFTVALALDSTQGHSNGYCTDFVITGNVVSGYVGGESILVHAGERGTITGNVCRNTLLPIGINGVVAGDTIDDITVTGNTFTNCIAGATAGTAANYSLVVSGGAPAPNPNHVTVSNNVCANGNQINKNATWGGIALGNTDDVIVSSNSITNAVANGVVFINPCNNAMVINNHIDTLNDDGLGNRMGIELSTSATGTSGLITGNHLIGTMAAGVRLEGAASCPTLTVGQQFFQGTFTNRFVNATNANPVATYDNAVQVSNLSAIYSSTAAPGAGTGTNGDFALRQDTAAASTTNIYKKSGGAWTPIL